MDKNDIDSKKLHSRNRVKKLKKAIVTGTLSMLAFTSLLCVLAFLRIAQLENELDGYTIKEEPQVTYDSPTNLTYSNGGNGDTSVLVNPSVNSIYDYEYKNNDDFSKEIKVDPYEGYTKIYLTFDDGPSPNTDHILDILDDYGIKATFFVNGHEGYEAQYIRIVNEGHTIGMHSFSHSYKDVYKDLDSFADDLFRIQSYIKDLTGVTCTLYRFPGGSSNQVGRIPMEDCISYLDAKGIVYFDWNVSCEDAVVGGASVNTIVNNVVTQVTYSDSDTIVILLHDTADKGTTVEALPIIIEKLAGMENVVILPITDDTVPVQHIISN